MKKTILFMILCVTSLLTAYSQDTAKLNLKEITYYLIEGVECKEILIERNKQLRSKDSTISITKNFADSCKKEYNILYKDNVECNKQYNKLRTSYDKKQNQLMLFKGTTVGLIIVFLIQIAI